MLAYPYINTRGRLGEFFVLGLHNCLEFSQPPCAYIRLCKHGKLKCLNELTITIIHRFSTKHGISKIFYNVHCQWTWHVKMHKSNQTGTRNFPTSTFYHSLKPKDQWILVIKLISVKIWLILDSEKYLKTRSSRSKSWKTI